MSLPEELVWNPVQSTNIKALAHHNGDLYVEFQTGAMYKYESVPEGVFQSLLIAPSVGQALNSFIKPNYAWERI